MRVIIAAIIGLWIGPTLASEVPSARGKPKAKAPAIKGYVKQVPQPSCLKPVSVVGSQYLNDAGAEDSAKKGWAEAVRFHHGEAFMDMANARDYARRCTRSSIGEVAGQVFFRCEITATPCRPAFTEDK